MFAGVLFLYVVAALAAHRGPVECFSEPSLGNSIQPNMFPQQNEHDVYEDLLIPCSLTIPYLDVDHVMPTEYRMDTALLYVVSRDLTVVYKWQHGDCYECPLFETTLPTHLGIYNCSQRIQTKYPNVIRVEVRSSSSPSIIGSCDLRTRLTDRGVYQLNISSADGGQSVSCNLQSLNSPPNPDLPMLYAFIVYAGLAVIWVVLVYLYKRGTFDKLLGRLPWNKTKGGEEETNVEANIASYESKDDTIKSEGNENVAYEAASVDAVEAEGMRNGTGSASTVASVNNSTPASPPPSSLSPSGPPETVQKQPKQRLRSLDAFRGLSLIVMIFVNYGSAGYYYIEHAIWNGLTVGDLVFPWFIFMMGTSMVFSFQGLFKRNTPVYQILWKIIWRSVILFGLGIFLGTKYDNNLEWLRIPGVLQRFSFTYLITALVHFPFAKRAAKKEKSLLGDILYYWPEWIIMLAILALHLALTFALPVPDCPAGYLGPGGLANNASHWSCTGGAAGYIDKKVLGVQHIYRTPTIQEVYYTKEPFDPEGILGSLTSIFLCFLGLQAGKIIYVHKDHVPILIRWFIWAIVTGLIALLLCNAKQEGGWIPLNKNLWSLSYILAMASTGFLSLAILYVVIDVLHLWNGSPLVYPGMNSIVIYICQSSFSINFPVSWQMPDSQSHWQQLIVDCWGASFWTFVAYVLYRKNIFVAL